MLEPLIFLSSLVFLEVGWIMRSERGSSLFFSLGWLLFGLYWPSMIPGYLKIGDYFNAFFCAAAVPLFLYVSLNQMHAYSKGKRVKGLETIALGVFITTLTYFLIEYVDPLSSFLRETSAVEAGAFAGMLGISTVVEGSMVFGARTTFEIVLACTALQSIMIFIGFIVASRESTKKKVIAALTTSVVIYVLNIVRNGGIIFLSESGIMDFDTAHNLLGKTASLAALFVLALFVLLYLPSIYDSFAESISFMRPKKLRIVARGGGLSIVPLLVSPFVSYFNTDLSFILVLLSFFLVLFFRDPDRETGHGIVSPADGKVLYARERDGVKEIAIFMSLTDVHVNRAPSDGKVSDIRRGNRRHAPAFSERSKKNNYAITDMGQIKVKQITGIFARRIVNYLRVGQDVRKGERIGLIRFGSRVELYAEAEGSIRVRKGDRVIAGETTLID
jgi:phosphatidylserine decarboxylase